MRLCVVGMLLAFATLPALAQETVPTVPVTPIADALPPPPPRWNGEVSAGYVATEGNSATRTSNARGELIYQSKAGLLHAAQQHRRGAGHQRDRHHHRGQPGVDFRQVISP